MFLNFLPGWPLPIVAIALPLLAAFILGCSILLRNAYEVHRPESFEFKRIYLKFPFLFFLFLNFVLSSIVWSYARDAGVTFFMLGGTGWTEAQSAVGSGIFQMLVLLDPLGAISAFLTSFIVLVAGLRSLADKADPITPNKAFFFLLTLGGVLGIFYAGGVTNLLFFLLLSQAGATGLYQSDNKEGLLLSLRNSYWYVLSRVLLIMLFAAGVLLLAVTYKVSGFGQLRTLMEPGTLVAVAYVLLSAPLFFLFIKSSSHSADSSKRCYFAMRSYAAFFALLRVNFLLFGRVQGFERIPWLYILLGGTALLAAFLLALTDRDPVRFTESVELFMKGFITVSLGLSLSGTSSALSAAEYGLGALESMLSLWMLFLPISAALSIIGAFLKQQYAGRELWSIGGLAHTLPFTGAVFFIVICGLAGLPPFPGFVSRQFLYRSANALNPFLTLFLFAMSLAILFMGIRYIAEVLFGKSPEGEEKIDGDKQIALPLFLILIFLFCTSAMPGRYYEDAVSKSVGSLMQASTAGAGELSGMQDRVGENEDEQDIPDVEPIPEVSE